MRPDKAQRRLRTFAIAVAAFFGLLTLATWWSGRENLREGSKAIGVGAPLRIKEVPVTYRVVYRVENRAGGSLVTTTERTWVHRPFESRTEIYAGPPPRGKELSVRQSAFGILASTSPRSQPLNIAAPPSLASGDIRVDAVLQTALDDKLIFRRERREVYGRRCQVYRAGGPVAAGDVKRLVAGTGEYADFCVDGNGIVMEEVWFIDNKLAQRRVAVEVETSPHIPSRFFAIDVPPSSSDIRGSVNRIDPGLTKKRLWTLAQPPDGFEYFGRFAVAFPPGAVPPAAGGGPGPAPNSTTDVFVRGPDLVVIDQDPSLASAIRAEHRTAESVTVRGLRDAKLIIDARMSEVRGETTDGSIVRIFGTVSPDELVDLAQRLRAAE